jgi:triosephosphate isomerase
MLTILVNICRFLIGATFVFSGFVKAVDPIGTQYKIQDYLGAIGLAGVLPDWVTLSTSVLLSAFEFSLGVFILLAIRRRLVSKLIVAFMAVMTLVTLWLALFNPVKDCGCFGDALHLTNTQTLIKNILLLAAAIVVVCHPLRMVRFLSRSTQWIAFNYTVLFVLLLSAHCLYHLPLIDFRPYHIGTNIKKGMEIPKGAPQPEFETTFILQKNGVKKEFTLDNYPDSSWQFVDSKTVLTKEGYVPPIHDFSIQKPDGDDITDSVLNARGYVFLLIAPHLEQADDSNFGDIDQLYEYCQEQKIPFYCLTASGEKDIRHWEDITGAEYPFCFTDETTLKTIIRSNPGLLLLKNGTIIRKWSHNDLPSSSKLNAPLSKLDIGAPPKKGIGTVLLQVVLWFFIPLFLLVFADRTWAWTRKIVRS